MTKSERLMYVLGLLKTQTAVHIADIARECNVSERTIYRDIGSLLKLGFIIQYRDGYKLMPEADLPANALDTDEIGLIEFCLRSNPLVKHPFFKRQFQTIQNKLSAHFTDVHGNGNGNGNGHTTSILMESFGPTLVLSAEADIFADFLRAIQMKRKVRIKTSDNSMMNDLLTPITICISDGNNVLRVIDDSGTARELEVNLVTALGVTDVPASPKSAVFGDTPGLEKVVDPV